MASGTMLFDINKREYRKDLLDCYEIAVGKKADLIRLSNKAKFIEILSLA